MAASPRTLHRPLALLALVLFVLVALWATAPVTPAQAACSDTFELPIEEETGEDLEAGPDDEVIEIALGAQRSRSVTVYAACDDEPKKKTNPNPGFGVFPGSASVPRRVFDERRGQAGRDAEQLTSSRKKRAKRAARKS